MSEINNGHVKTIAVFDLETTGLPSQQGNTCAITELCIYAFPAKSLAENSNQNTAAREQGVEGDRGFPNIPPELPRLVHKLTMLINPEIDINPIAAQMSGLTNAMLSNETPFDVKTANSLLIFLERLGKPICVVAHNGWTFDFPIIRCVLETINMAIPASVYCIDSLKAFRELDERYVNLLAINELSLREDELLARYRTVFSEPLQHNHRYFEMGRYVLGNIYERVFDQPAENLHRAESDVIVLTKLILHHGLVFLAYVEERKQSFDQVPKL